MTQFQNYSENGDFSGNMNNLKSSEFKKQLLSPSTELKTLSFIACRLLHLKDGFLDELESFPQTVRDHEPLSYWVLNFLENNYQKIEDISLKKDLSEELLAKIGFQESSDAVKTIMKRSKRIPDHVDPIDAVKRFVMDEFKYHPILSRASQESVGAKFQWESVQVLHMNGFSVMDENSRVLLSERLLGLCIDDKHTILYHGTDLESAHAINRDGIYICRGFQRRDFSSGSGFYLTDNYDHARDWAFSQTQKPVVLCFKIPTTLLKKVNSLDLTKESNESKWQEIVAQNRAGKPTKKLRRFLEDYDCIEGPISVLCKPERATDKNKHKSREAKPKSYQLCITNEDLADKVGDFLTIILTYNDNL